MAFLLCRRVITIKNIERYQETLNIIHNCEEKYGSLIYVSNDCPEYKRLRQLWPRDHGYKANANKAVESKRRAELIIKHVVQGYNPDYVRSHDKATAQQIKKITKEANVCFRPKFKYCISKAGESDIYFTNLFYLCIKLLNFNPRTSEIAYTRLENEGWSIEHVSLFWFQLPKNCRYLTKDTDQILIKNKLEDYAKFSA